MKRFTLALSLLVLATISSCTSFRAYQKGKELEIHKDYDNAVLQYEKALEVDPENIRYQIALQHARMEASRAHFEKGKALRAAGRNDLAVVELELAVRLDQTNQFAAVELGKAIRDSQDAVAANEPRSVDDVKRRAKAKGMMKAQPPQLNPASQEPISLSFPRETPVKDIYRALGNSFGINILFDAGVKDERISIELRDVTAQDALERVMQAANHFYKVLDEKTIIVIPDTPQTRRDYEDLVIRTFYLSNGDAEQVTNVVRTMIEARNVFPLKALNAITIRDTADKVRIAEKIIEANDKAKAEVVIDVELLQLDITKARDIGIQLNSAGTAGVVDADGKARGTIRVPDFGSIGINDIAFTVPTIAYSLVKSNSDAQLLAKPQLRISEGEKASLHIGQRIPVPVSTFTSANPGGGGSTFAPVTSFQYQDVGIKITIEPRVHHNREVTLKLEVEVSNLAGFAPSTNPPQPIIGTRTIQSTIRLKDGETNFLAGLIRKDDSTRTDTIPFLGDLPLLGRLFQKERKDGQNTDLVLTMSPHIIRIPDITEEDVAPMWVGTSGNLTFRGVSPRVESQSGVDPFINTRPVDDPDAALESEAVEELLAPPGNAPTERFPNRPPVQITPGTGPNDPFLPPVNPVPPTPRTKGAPTAQEGRIEFSPRLSPQPGTLTVKAGEEKIWGIVGMDLEGLSTSELVLHYDPLRIDVSAVSVGAALDVDPMAPPMVSIDRSSGTIRVVPSSDKPLMFRSGGEVLSLRVRGTRSGESFFYMEQPEFANASGHRVAASVSGGKTHVD